MTDVLRFTVKANTYAELVDQASDEISRLLDGNLTGVKWSMSATARELNMASYDDMTAMARSHYTADVTVEVEHTEFDA